jgi:hypothetical protein
MVCLLHIPTPPILFNLVMVAHTSTLMNARWLTYRVDPLPNLLSYHRAGVETRGRANSLSKLTRQKSANGLSMGMMRTYPGDGLDLESSSYSNTISEQVLLLIEVSRSLVELRIAAPKWGRVWVCGIIIKRDPTTCLDDGEPWVLTVCSSSRPFSSDTDATSRDQRREPR